MADDTVGKVTAAREHRDPGLGCGTLDIDRTDGNQPSEDADNLRAGVSVRSLQYPHQFAQDDRRHDNRFRLFDHLGRFARMSVVAKVR